MCLTKTSSLMISCRDQKVCRGPKHVSSGLPGPRLFPTLSKPGKTSPWEVHFLSAGMSEVLDPADAQWNQATTLALREGNANSVQGDPCVSVSRSASGFICWTQLSNQRTLPRPLTRFNAHALCFPVLACRSTTQLVLPVISDLSWYPDFYTLFRSF